tara:strand:- start:357 stop:506 length:150 start_codon:yes stop_codon:yes gene_type:complete
MKGLKGWMFLLIALLWLLPMVGVDQLGSIGDWLVVLAVAVIGFVELKGM